MKYRGMLAQAAPNELAMLTSESLIADSNEDSHHFGSRREGPFQFLDRDFLPPSPAHGPFLELLTYAPSVGLTLIQKITERGIEFLTRGRAPGADGLLINFEDGARFFPWANSYRWSRGEENYYALASGLMALEAWAHKEIETGRDFAAVLKDVLGPPGTPAAFVLIAVDLILSHWPKSESASIPFLGCPELLSLDRTRQAFDQMGTPDFVGLAALRGRLNSSAATAELQRRLSRRVPLERVIGNFGATGPEDLRKKLELLLQEASQRLGAPEPSSDFGDPRLMARFGLNLVEPKNWVRVQRTAANGAVVNGWEYVSPLAEANYVAALEAGAAPRAANEHLESS